MAGAGFGLGLPRLEGVPMSAMKHSLVRLVPLALFAGLVSTAAVDGQAGRWVELGPYGGEVTAIAFEPGDGDIWVVAGGSAFVRGRDDARWRPSDEGLGACVVYDLDVASRFVVAATRCGAFRRPLAG